MRNNGKQMLTHLNMHDKDRISDRSIIKSPESIPNTFKCESAIISLT